MELNIVPNTTFNPADAVKFFKGIKITPIYK